MAIDMHQKALSSRRAVATAQSEPAQLGAVGEGSFEHNGSYAFFA
jgi:hypothetical protein